MAAYFFDSSALVKRYARETGTVWVLSHFKPTAKHQIYVAGITLVEVVSALTRRMRSNSLSPIQTAKAVARFQRHFHHQLFKADITPSLIKQATSLVQKHALRGYDAIQLAAALETNNIRISIQASSLMLISADNALNAAALLEGLSVDNPNNHP